MSIIAMATIAMPTYSLLYLGSHFGEQSVSDVEGRARTDWAWLGEVSFQVVCEEMGEGMCVCVWGGGGGGGGRVCVGVCGGGGGRRRIDIVLLQDGMISTLI